VDFAVERAEKPTQGYRAAWGLRVRVDFAAGSVVKPTRSISFCDARCRWFLLDGFLFNWYNQFINWLDQMVSSVRLSNFDRRQP
ncbi:MAG: hypothetical protein WBP55_07785, partial [Solirubrobacterales bacterium]